MEGGPRSSPPQGGNVQPPLPELVVAGLGFHHRGLLAEAERCYRATLAQEPDQPDALHLLGVLEAQRGRHGASAEWLRRSVAANPDDAIAHFNLGSSLREIGEIDAALASYGAALALAPDHVGALINVGELLQRLKRPSEALKSYDRGLAIQPHNTALLFNRGIVLRILGRLDKALESYTAVLAQDPSHVDARNNRGNVLATLKRYDEALAEYRAALAVQPGNVEALCNCAGVQCNRRLFHEALELYDKAVAANPRFARAYQGRARVLFELGRFEDAFRDYDAAYVLDEDLPYVEGFRLHLKMHLCDWNHLGDELARLNRRIRDGKPASEPFPLLPTYASAKEQLICARMFAADQFPPRETPLWRGQRYRHDRMRVAYVSGELRAQATAHLTAGLFECHDRGRFAVQAIATGVNDHSAMRRRLEQAFETFTDASGWTDEQIAEHVLHSEIDILVNLNGYFGVDRTGVFAMRPAPIQVNYLGYPGTMGADYMDYIVADEAVIPLDQQDCYSEKVVYLPDTYQPNDRKRLIGARSGTRQDHGLPDKGFVFCCFNNNHKLLPEMFAIWMRLLRNVPASVLWLLAGNSTVGRNLRAEAAKRSVAPERLVFAPLAPAQDHLARHAHADLFLDTLPHNAHTTASDALWAGLPVITCLGTTFAGRVAASLLKAAGLTQLISGNLEDYEAMGLKIAQDPAECSRLKTQLANNRLTCPLFDTARYTRHLEAAFATMHERYQHGLAPASFKVALP